MNNIVEQGVIYDADKKKVLGVDGFKREEFIVPETVEEIAPKAFKDCRILKKIIFSNGIKKIGDFAFYRCGLSDIILPETVETIGAYAFGLNNMSYVEIPKSVLNIGVAAFANVKKIVVYNTIDPEIKLGKSQENICGGPNANLPWVGINHNPIYTVYPLQPNSVWKNYELIVKSAETNDVIYKIWMCAEGEPKEVVYELVYAWHWNAIYPFTHIDNCFDKYKVFVDKVKTAIYRLKYPIDLDAEAEQNYLKYLKRMKNKIIKESKEFSEEDLKDLQKYIN